MVRNFGDCDKIANFMHYISMLMLRWVGNLVGIEEEIIPKEVMNVMFYNKRLAGKPKMKWEDIIQKIFRMYVFIVRDWRREMEYRVGWRQLLKRGQVL